MLSIVIPIYNESAILEVLYNRLTAAAPSWKEDYQVVLVDDGGEQAVTTAEVIVDGRLIPLAGLLRDRGHGDRIGILACEQNLGGVDDGLTGRTRHA